MKDYTTDTLSRMYNEWLTANSLPKVSAEELFYDTTIFMSPEQRNWVQAFYVIWDDCLEREDEVFRSTN